MTRRPSAPPLRRQRRSLIAIAVVGLVVLAVLALGFALIPPSSPKAPLFCAYGEVILNGVDQCLPAPSK